MGVVDAESILEAMATGVYVVDRDRRISFWNAEAARLTGYTAEEVVGRSCRDNILNHVDEHGLPLCLTKCPLAATMLDERPRATRAFLHHRAGHRVPVQVRSSALRGSGGTVVGAVECFTDDTAYLRMARRAEEARIASLTDPLTGLPNRRALDEAIAEAARQGPVAAVFVDIDSFKSINDRYGHATGDLVLRMVAGTLRSCARGEDVVGRWGGEEFLLLSPADSAEGTIAFAERLRRLVAASWSTCDGELIRVTVSAGVAVGGAGEVAWDLVARADAALMEAKSAGRNRVVCHLDHLDHLDHDHDGGDDVDGVDGVPGPPPAG